MKREPGLPSNKEAMMLNDLDMINWQQLTHAYGPADAVSELIKNLAFPSRERWEPAMEGLQSALLHQGTVYEATASAVPFLIELLESQEVQCRKEIVRTLASIANGGLADETAEAYGWVTNAHHAVAQGLPVYLRLLGEADREIRMAVPFVLSFLGELAPSVLPMLDRTLRKETDPQVKAHLLYLSAQPGYAEGIDQWLTERGEAGSEHPFVRTVAALLHTWYVKEQTPPETVQILLQALVQSEAIRGQYGLIPWIHGDIVGDMSKTLLLLPVDTAPQTLPRSARYPSDWISSGGMFFCS